jgi:hypothetical protein
MGNVSARETVSDNGGVLTKIPVLGQVNGRLKRELEPQSDPELRPWSQTARLNPEVNVKINREVAL